MHLLLIKNRILPRGCANCFARVKQEYGEYVSEDFGYRCTIGGMRVDDNRVIPADHRHPLCPLVEVEDDALDWSKLNYMGFKRDAIDDKYAPDGHDNFIADYYAGEKGMESFIKHFQDDEDDDPMGSTIQILQD